MAVIYAVLILILMEHAQRVYTTVGLTLGTAKVLILILMEHAQRAKTCFYENKILSSYVLILILMEHAQREHFL